MNANQKLIAGLTAGSPIFLDVEGLKLRLTSVLIGMAPSRFILVNVPKQTEVQPQILYPFLYPGNQITCYSMLPGVVTAFKSHIIRFVMSPFPLLFLSFPNNCDCVDVRRHARIHCLFEAVLRSGQNTMKGMITDVSLGGCCFEVFNDEQNKNHDISKQTPVTLESWQLKAENDTAINAVVQSIAAKFEHECIGLKFEELPGETYKTLEVFITNALQLSQ